MEKSRDNSQFTAKLKDESKKYFDRDKKLIQKKEFHLEKFIDEVVSSYEDNFTSDKDFTE